MRRHDAIPCAALLLCAMYFNNSVAQEIEVREVAQEQIASSKLFLEKLAGAWEFTGTHKTTSDGKPPHVVETAGKCTASLSPDGMILTIQFETGAMTDDPDVEAPTLYGTSCYVIHPATGDLMYYCHMPFPRLGILFIQTRSVCDAEGTQLALKEMESGIDADMNARKVTESLCHFVTDNEYHEHVILESEEQVEESDYTWRRKEKADPE